MARASFTLKRYLPLNTETAELSDWAVFNGNAGSGASTTTASGLFGYSGGETFDIIVRASSPKWVPDTSADGVQVLCWAGSFGVSQSFLLYINPADAGAVAGTLEADINCNSQSGYVASEVVPFVNGATYWIKFSFNKDNLTGAFSYAPDQENEPTSWTLLSNTSSTLSNLTAFTSFTGADNGIGIYDVDTTDTSNRFNGNIYRVITRTFVGEVTDYYYYTGSSENFTVPAGVTTVDALLWGGGYTGGQVFGSMAVTGGEVLTIRVGGANNGLLGGWPNGGDGGANTYFNYYSDGGCGSSDIYSGVTPLMVAGGRGGRSPSDIGDPHSPTYVASFGAMGGAGSTTAYLSTINTPNGCNGYVNYWGGRGGSQTAGGAAGNTPTKSWITSYPTAGTLGQGGNGASTNASFTGGSNDSSGGGGGGYYGGGGGGILVGTGSDATSTKSGFDGGGGSSYVNISRCSNYKFSSRPIVIPDGTQSWNAAGPDSMSSSSFEYVPLIITDTVDGSSGTVIYGPPQPDYDLNAYDGLVVLRYTD